MTIHNIHEHTHSSFSQPPTMVSYVGVQTPVQLFLSIFISRPISIYIYIHTYSYTSKKIYKKKREVGLEEVGNKP
jgi:hypothetical protein